MNIHIFEEEIQQSCFRLLNSVQKMPLVKHRINQDWNLAMLLDMAKRTYQENSFRECDKILGKLINSL